MNILVLIGILIILILYNTKDIETFLNDIDYDDFVFVPTKDTNQKDKTNKNMLNNYYIKVVPEYEKGKGFLSDIYDYMGKDSHHYLFESPHIDNESYDFNKNFNAYYSFTDEKYNIDETYGRPITYPTDTEKDKFLKNEQNLDNILINTYPKYRNPLQLGNKIVYDFSNSEDFKHLMRERELRLRGFRRSSLTPEDDYLSMTFCDDIDEKDTDFPCGKFGKKFNYNLENRLRLAKYRDPKTHPNIDIETINYINNISSNICCI
jgi:hypothetical protein